MLQLRLVMSLIFLVIFSSYLFSVPQLYKFSLQYCLLISSFTFFNNKIFTFTHGSRISTCK